jgi:hypothetical protein
MIDVLIVLLCFAAGIGIAISLFILVPLCLYVFPYELWVGNEQLKGKQTDKKEESPFRAARNATRLYSAWIRRQRPNL